jgi:hypothetical protein
MEFAEAKRRFLDSRRVDLCLWDRKKQDRENRAMKNRTVWTEQDRTGRLGFSRKFR